MSALTKILIIIVSILAFVLAAVSAVYVGSAENYKEQAISLKNDLNVIKQEKAALQTAFEAKNQQWQANQEKMQKEAEELARSNTDLEIDLRTAERTGLEYQRRMDGLLAELTGLRTTIQNMELSLQKTQEELTQARSTSVKEKTELTQLTDTLYQRIVEIQNLEVQVKRLLEEKTILEDQISGSYSPAADVQASIITPEIDAAVPAIAEPISVAATSGLKGLLTSVKGGLAEVSIGAADGLKKNDVLHVYRGGDFICDISVTDVDTNKAAGVIELEQQRPRIGDTATSEF